MKINELTKQLSEGYDEAINNKKVIDFLKSKGYKISSHMQNATDEMIAEADKHFKTLPKTEKKIEKKEVKVENPKTENKVVSAKKFNPEDQISCRSVTPWKLNALGVDRNTVYHWEYFGDVDYIAYKDLQAMRRKDIITKPKIIIEDPDLCSQWAREIGEIYKPFLGVDYPEELFDLTDEEFENLLKESTDTVKEVIKVTAVNMVKNGNYPTVQKLTKIDDILGTCIKEFL